MSVKTAYSLGFQGELSMRCPDNLLDKEIYSLDDGGFDGWRTKHRVRAQLKRLKAVIKEVISSMGKLFYL